MYVTRLRCECDRYRVHWHILLIFLGQNVLDNPFTVAVATVAAFIGICSSFLQLARCMRYVCGRSYDGRRVHCRTPFIFFGQRVVCNTFAVAVATVAAFVGICSLFFLVGALHVIRLRS